jgi:hypothetical protein
MCKVHNVGLRYIKSLGPLKMSREMAHKVIVPQKKNYNPQFLKQRDINSYNLKYIFSRDQFVHMQNKCTIQAYLHIRNAVIVLHAYNCCTSYTV